ncbi:MAG: hypothetical protein RR891_00970 [Clostridium sp.]|uniref:hypothetical protein n=1 Tax=Clostridium sp. TaxID=1506 RepID=UPI00302725EF
MDTMSMLDKIIQKLYIVYIELVYKTSNIEFNRDEVNEKILRNCILGFWHGDSYVMNLFMKKILEDNIRIKVVVTEDKRGDYIEGIINNYGGEALRMPDGVRMKGFLKELKAESRIEESTLGIAMDGPLGPLHDPKKIGFMLSKEGGKAFVGIKVKLSSRISLVKRWDKYQIPLPFTKISFTACNFNIISNEFLSDFKDNKKFISERLVENV